MGKHNYSVMGATGHIGSVVTRRLLEAGHTVRAIGRSEEKLKSFSDQGAQVCAAAFDDAEALSRGFEGADGLFAMIPSDMRGPDYRAFQDRVGEAIAEAIAKVKVRHVVNLSSVGGHLTEKSGVILGLHFQEERLDALPEVGVIHLRPAYFMENLLFLIDVIRTQGVLGSALRPDLKIPMIATKDIGDRAATLLLGLDFRGKSTMELLGERDLSFSEVAPILGRAIGKPDLKYVPFPYEGIEAAMQQMGMPEKTATLMTEMYRGFNEGIIKPTEARSRRNTTPTSIEEFAKTVFAPAFPRS